MVSSRSLTFALVSFVSMMVAPGVAGAAQRYASPTGTGTACTSGTPCPIEEAINNATSPSDEVIVNSGTYTLTSGQALLAYFGGDVHGAVGGPRPVIQTNAVNGLSGAGGTVSDLRIIHTGTGTGFSIGGATGVGQRLEVTSTGSQSCNVSAGGVLRDSFCINNKTTAGNKYALQSIVGGGTSIGYARNVTAVATGTGSYGVYVLAQSSGGSATLDLRNVIASGTQKDVRVDAVAGATATGTLAYSNYDSTELSASGTPTVTPFGTGTNQATAPQFANAPAGDYHEAPLSPTIDAGSVDARTGTLDVDGEARVQGTAVDIGADEAAATGLDTTPPATSIDKGPKKKTKSKKATFEFSADEAGATFECTVDKKPARPCASPLKLKKLKPGKHKLAVTATDGAGNTDATPAIYKWKVKKKH
jgi:hypothetical protein